MNNLSDDRYERVKKNTNDLIIFSKSIGLVSCKLRSNVLVKCGKNLFLKKDLLEIELLYNVVNVTLI